MKTLVKKGLFVANKHLPEILVVGGTVGAATSTFLACRATLKLSEDVLPIILEGKEDLVNDESLTDDEKSKAIMELYRGGALDVARLYLPAVTLGVLSISAIAGSHYILRKRNLAVMAAYKAVDEGFKQYRERVINDVGVDKDREYKHGVSNIKVKEKITDEDGKTKTVTKEVPVGDVNDLSEYARIFDEVNHNWVQDPEYNMMFLKTQQQYLNDKLKANGVVFLNEVYQALGFPITSAGQVVGWTDDGSGDNYIDFGMFDLYSSKGREFVNGYEPSVVLDFNVDGMVYDKIK